MATNLEGKLAYDRAYYHANRARVLERMSATRTKEKERLFREANREAIRAYKRAWYKANRERLRIKRGGKPTTIAFEDRYSIR
jgi:hypothetical protein